MVERVSEKLISGLTKEQKNKIRDAIETKNAGQEDILKIIHGMGLSNDKLQNLLADASVTKTVKQTKKIPVNSPCICGSGKKYKKCCGM